MGVFIQIEVDDSALTIDMRRKLVSVCPVDIFRLERDRLVARQEEEDECTLCELCLDIAPTGSLTILKTYSEQRLHSRGTYGVTETGCTFRPAD